MPPDRESIPKVLFQAVFQNFPGQSSVSSSQKDLYQESWYYLSKTWGLWNLPIMCSF